MLQGSASLEVVVTNMAAKGGKGNAQYLRIQCCCQLFKEIIAPWVKQTPRSGTYRTTQSVCSAHLFAGCNAPYRSKHDTRWRINWTQVKLWCISCKRIIQASADQLYPIVGQSCHTVNLLKIYHSYLYHYPRHRKFRDYHLKGHLLSCSFWSYYSFHNHG